MFSHYLVTRFNIHERQWRTIDKNKKRVCDDAWMDDRFRLFIRYCAPSVAAQTCENFKWLILFHHKTAQKWRDIVDVLAEEYSFHPLYVGLNWLRELQAYLGGRSHQWLITTRLDNDDAIAPGYLEQVQATFARQKLTFVDAPLGYRLNETGLYEHDEAFNPFMSLIERGTRKSVLHVAHGRAVHKFKHIRLPGRRWLQVIHSRNYINNTVSGVASDGADWVKEYL